MDETNAKFGEAILSKQAFRFGPKTRISERGREDVRGVESISTA